MNLRASILGTVLSLTTSTSAQEAVLEPLGLHGSGTTSLSECFGHIMSKFEEQIKLPSRFSYRSVGSGTGIKEFLGKGINDVDTTTAYTDFGAGDIPIAREDREAWLEKGIEFVQLPFVLSAVSFFHNIPGVPSDGVSGLNLTACLLARVFGGDITTWDHPEIMVVNPNLNIKDGYPIFVGRRMLGSSSTHSITNYLYAQCPMTEGNPKGWPLEKVGVRIEWHPSTNPCDGSGNMAKCIRENEGSIGYVDAAYGHQEGLSEIKLKNGDGRFLTSKEVGDEGVQAAAFDLTNVPDSADGDFSGVSLYNKPGPNTWPITLASYVYIRKDLSFITNPARRHLLKAFASALFDPDYIGLCDRYGFVPVPTQWRELSLSGLELLQVNADESYEWTFEKNTMPGLGQGDHVISMKRKGFNVNEADHLSDDVSLLTERVSQLELELASMRAQMELLLTALANPTTTAVNNAASTDDSTITATINQPDEMTGNEETTAAVTDPTITAVNNVVVSNADDSTNAITINQPDEMTGKKEENATAVVIHPNTAAVNRSFEGTDDDFLPRISSAECLLSTIGKYSALFITLSLTLF